MDLIVSVTEFTYLLPKIMKAVCKIDKWNVQTANDIKALCLYCDSHVFLRGPYYFIFGPWLKEKYKKSSVWYHPDFLMHI